MPRPKHCFRSLKPQCKTNTSRSLNSHLLPSKHTVSKIIIKYLPRAKTNQKCILAKISMNYDSHINIYTYIRAMQHLQQITFLLQPRLEDLLYCISIITYQRCSNTSSLWLPYFVISESICDQQYMMKPVSYALKDTPSSPGQ